MEGSADRQHGFGQKAIECMPKILQAFIEKPEDAEKGLEFDRRLYIVRKVFEQSNEETFVISLSSRTIVYKECSLWDSSEHF